MFNQPNQLNMSSQDKIITVSLNEVPQIENSVQKRTGQKWVMWGEKNTFPQTLIELSNQSSKHKAILNAKGRFLGTLKVESVSNPSEAQRLNDSINPFETFAELYDGVKSDINHFGGFALIWEWNIKGGCASIERIAFEKVRVNEDFSIFYVSEKWNDKRFKITGYAPFDDTKREGKQIIYYREPQAGLDIYPSPEYIAALKYIQVDARIADFHQSNLVNGFFPGAVVSFYDGEPEPAQKTQIEQAFNRKYAGNSNAGKIILTFNNPGSTPVSVSNFDSKGRDEMFQLLNNQVLQEIFVAHNVTSPMLFGVRVEGQLGGRTEMMEAFELLNTMWAIPKMERLAKFFSMLFEYCGLEKNSVKYEKLQLFQTDTNTQVQTKLSDQREVISEEIKAIENALIALFEVKGVDAELYEILDEESEPFNVSMADDQKDAVIDAKVLRQLSKTPNASVFDIAESLSIKEEEVIKSIQRLITNGDIKIQDRLNAARELTQQGEDRLKIAKPMNGIEVRYKYGVRPNMGADIIDGTRTFCRRMPRNRLFTRQEIDQLSEMFGWDVWSYRGGWYHDPKTGYNHKSCRHEWKQVIVKAKS